MSHCRAPQYLALLSVEGPTGPLRGSRCRVPSSLRVKRRRAGVTARGDGGTEVFETELDRRAWLETGRALDEEQALRLVREGAALLGLPDQRTEWEGRGRWVGEKPLPAALVGRRTGVRNAWLAEQLEM